MRKSCQNFPGEKTRKPPDPSTSYRDERGKITHSFPRRACLCGHCHINGIARAIKMLTLMEEVNDRMPADCKPRANNGLLSGRNGFSRARNSLSYWIVRSSKKVCLNLFQPLRIGREYGFLSCQRGIEAGPVEGARTVASGKRLRRSSAIRKSSLSLPP